MSKPPMPDPLHVLELRVEKLENHLRWATKRVQPLPADSADMDAYEEVKHRCQLLVDGAN